MRILKMVFFLEIGQSFDEVHSAALGRLPIIVVCLGHVRFDADAFFIKSAQLVSSPCVSFSGRLFIPVNRLFHIGRFLMKLMEHSQHQFSHIAALSCGFFSPVPGFFFIHHNALTGIVEKSYSTLCAYITEYCCLFIPFCCLRKVFQGSLSMRIGISHK